MSNEQCNPSIELLLHVQYIAAGPSYNWVKPRSAVRTTPPNMAPV